MFSAVYQNGEYGIEIFAPSGNEPFKMCKLSNENNIKKVYDRSIKGYMAALEKESSSTFLQIPRSSKSSLGISQPLLIFQIQLHPEKSFTLELILLDSDRQKRRFHLSTNFKEIDASNLHVSIPWIQPDREQWTNVAINLVDLIANFSPPGSNLTYFGLESFSIQPVCRLRKIFTLPLKYLGDEDTGLLIPPKYDFTSGVEANSWVFNYVPPAVSTKTISNKDHEATQKNSKLPTKPAGDKDSDMMGIVGKKVPRQEPVASKAISISKTDAGSGDESALKRQKAVPAAPTAVPTAASVPAPVAVAAPASNPWGTIGSTAPTPLRKNAKRDVDVHMVVTVEEPMELAMDAAEHTSEPSQPATAPTPAVVLPAGGIKLSSKLKQKLGSAALAGPPATAAPEVAPVANVPLETTAEAESVLERSPPSTPPAARRFGQNTSLQEEQHEVDVPTLPTLPTSKLAHQPPASTRSSMDEGHLPMASQDFSAIDDFVKNYEAQQGNLQGYASFARVEAEVAEQLNNQKQSGSVQVEEKTAVPSEGIAANTLQEFMQQVKRHERTPSRAKKFADVALSPMPVMPSVESTRIVSENVTSLKTHEEVDIINRRDEEPTNAVESDKEEPTLNEPERHSSRPPTAPAQVHSRPSTAGAQVNHNVLSRPSTSTAHTQEEVIAMHLRLPTPPPTSQLASRPPTAPSAEPAPIAEHAQVSTSHPSPSRPSSARPASARASSSRPSTGRRSANELESALMSPFSEAMAYFEQGKQSHDFSARPAQTDITAEQVRSVDHDHENENEPPNSTNNGSGSSFFEQYQERSAAISQQWTEDIDALLNKLSQSPTTRPGTSKAEPVAKNSSRPSTANATASVLSPSAQTEAFTTPLPERKKRAIRARVASLLLQVEQAEMEYIAEFGFEAFEQEVGFFEEKVRSRRH